VNDPELLDDLAVRRKNTCAGTRAVILAGGQGTRLAPYTSVLPKPLMPVGDRAILEHVVDQLERYGMTNITFCVSHLGHLIEAVFENRMNGSARITYVREQETLGTAGPLRLVEGLRETFLVMNGDLLTDLDYSELIHFHKREKYALTIATHKRITKLDYGVLHVDNRNHVTGFEEKPEMLSQVSMGIYLIEPAVLEFIPDGRFDFPDLVLALLEQGRPVGAYVHDGLWFDIGRKEDYERAVTIWLEQPQPASAVETLAAWDGDSEVVELI
jgi:NDP-sugar pyrophosphorylase family protein